MKILFPFFLFFLFLTFKVHAASIPVYSANGFACGRMGVTVTCKGPLPGSAAKDSITATGHNLVYLTVDTQENGQPLRYTYFSDTGCLVGYTFGMDGKPAGVVARHRSGSKANFQIQNENYDSVVAYCEQNLPGSPNPITGFDAPGMKSTPSIPAAVPAKPAAKIAPQKTAK